MVRDIRCAELSHGAFSEGGGVDVKVRRSNTFCPKKAK